MCHLGIVDFYWPLCVRRRNLTKVFIGCQVFAVALSWSGGRSLQWQDKAETLMVCPAEGTLYGNVIGFVLWQSLDLSLRKLSGRNPGHKGLTELTNVESQRICMSGNRVKISHSECLRVWNPMKDCLDWQQVCDAKTSGWRTHLLFSCFWVLRFCFIKQGDMSLSEMYFSY